MDRSELSLSHTRSNVFIRTYIERVTSRKRFVSRCEVDGGVAGEGRVAGVPDFHSWGVSAPCH